MREKAFEKGKFISTDELPDHLREEILELAQTLLVNAGVNMDTKAQRDPNVSLAALQRALGLCIAKFFPRDQLPMILAMAHESLVASANEWSKNERSESD